mmetsp:Transcript_65122/g.72723  ORF Transcript_65122/g.72723 Transcript_65122/m.72723 type:complete len:239 (+) Transcript_65122:64-780(+)
MRCMDHGASPSQAMDCEGAKGRFGREACEHYIDDPDPKKEVETKKNTNQLLNNSKKEEEEQTRCQMLQQQQSYANSNSLQHKQQQQQQQNAIVVKSVPMNESDNMNTNEATTATSIRIFRHPETRSQQDDHNNSDHNNNNNNHHHQRTQPVHSVNLMSSDLQHCHTGYDVLKKALQVAQTYHSLLFSFEDHDLAEQIRTKAKKYSLSVPQRREEESHILAIQSHDTARDLNYYYDDVY